MGNFLAKELFLGRVRPCVARASGRLKVVSLLQGAVLGYVHAPCWSQVRLMLGLGIRCQRVIAAKPDRSGDRACPCSLARYLIPEFP